MIVAGTPHTSLEPDWRALVSGSTPLASIIPVLAPICLLTTPPLSLIVLPYILAPISLIVPISLTNPISLIVPARAVLSLVKYLQSH